MVILDTTLWIDYLGGVTSPHTSWLNRELTRQRLGLTDLILCEILQGNRADATFTQAHQDYAKFQVFSTGGVDLAVASVLNYRPLRKRGFTMRKTIDCLIATFCIEAGHWLLDHDHDFDPFEKHLGLQIIHP